MYMCSCVIVCHPSPLQSAYHLAKPVRSFRAAPDTWTPTGQGEVWVRVRTYVGEEGRRETVVSCAPSSLHLYLLFFSHTIPSAPSISPPSYCRGQGGEERGQMGWNEVHLHYLLPPLPFHSSPPISPSIPSCPPLFLRYRLPSSPSLGLARVVWWWRG